MPADASALDLALAGLLAFLIGTFPSGMLVCRLLGKPAPRHAGSRNIGATNVFRVGGSAAGLLTLILDVSKGAMAVYIAQDSGAAIAAFGVVLGHLAPPWPGFKGGKGVATAAGALGVLAFWPLLPALGVFLILLASTRIVSAASLAAVAAYPLFAVLLSAGRSVAGVGILVAVLVAFGHRDNLTRIREGREPPIGRPGTGGS
ncbi:MAG: glycerol-3-phosphate 1-O-acyltransferase PlsY [Acidobacteria bacterium]|uniref:Glycerol-3-phosphate acyltransferase n=1 Tax=Candidatus Polarisedimenticola svalbardensis TaxID=2886004 RepID=A0A8J7C2F8_9BACT|nr:glycerol-3-phosphate 1-O-acyltransferase PlsY [Candidatus Polarisedimenticola svalbardensis]